MAAVNSKDVERHIGRLEETGENVADAIRLLSYSVKAGDASGGTDAAGGHVTSLTEAVMGLTAGLVKIAEAISDVAEAVRERR